MFRHEKPLYLRVLSYQLFSFNLNLLLGATTFTLTLVVFLLIKCASNKSKMSFLTIFMMFFQSSCEQSTNLKLLNSKKLKWTIFFIFASWWIFFMIVNTVYKSRLSAFM
ncbi:unnamed protein product, partial [Tenebrio molitor]